MKSLRSITMQEQADLELVHPTTADKLGVFITLAGPEHPARKKFELEKDRKLRHQLNKTGAVQLDDPEVDRERLIDYLCTCTLGWYCIDRNDAGETVRVDAIDLGEGPVPYSAAGARQLYTDASLVWVRMQVRDGINKNDVFIRDSSRSSSNTPAGSPASPSA